MTRDEFKQLQELLAKAERIAEQQTNAPDGARWLSLWIDLKAARLAVRDFIDSEAEACNESK